MQDENYNADNADNNYNDYANVLDTDSNLVESE
jgi:hypothetical protein